MEEKVNLKPYDPSRTATERKPNKYEKEIADWFEQLLRKYSDIGMRAEIMVGDKCGISMSYPGFDEYNVKNGILDPSDDDACIYICDDFENIGVVWCEVKRHHNDVFVIHSDTEENDRTYIKVLKRVLYFKPLIEKFFEMEAKRQMETGDGWWVK